MRQRQCWMRPLCHPARAAQAWELARFQTAKMATDYICSPDTPPRPRPFGRRPPNAERRQRRLLLPLRPQSTSGCMFEVGVPHESRDSDPQRP